MADLGRGQLGGGWERDQRVRPRVARHLPELGFRVQGSGSRVQGPGPRVQGPGFRVQGPGFRVAVVQDARGGLWSEVWGVNEVPLYCRQGPVRGGPVIEVAL